MSRLNPTVELAATHPPSPLAGFWKGWHCSFNRWLVRYVYVPLGGHRHGYGYGSSCSPVQQQPSNRHTPTHTRCCIDMVCNRRQALAAFVVFVFVALWHDMNSALFTWGLLFGILFAPEQALLSRIRGIPSPTYVMLFICCPLDDMFECTYACMHACMYVCLSVCMYVCMYVFMHVCISVVFVRVCMLSSLLLLHAVTSARWACSTILGAVTIFLLMVANLIGFSVGTQGMRAMLMQLIAEPRIVLYALLLFCAAVQIMLFQRSAAEKVRQS